MTKCGDAVFERFDGVSLIMAVLKARILLGYFFVAMAMVSNASAEDRLRIDLTQTVREASIVFGVPAFHTAVIARSTDISGRFYTGTEKPEWADFGSFKLFYVKGESTSDLLKLGDENMKLLKNAMANKGRLTGAVILDASGLDGKYFAQQFGRMCELNVEWRVASRININLFTGERPIKKMDACGVFSWVLSAQNVEFVTDEVDGEVRFILRDRADCRGDHKKLGSAQKVGVRPYI